MARDQIRAGAKPGVADVLLRPCRTNPDMRISRLSMAAPARKSESLRVDKPQANVKIPIGKTVRVVFELDELRAETVAMIQEVSVEGVRDVNTVKEHIRSGLAKAIYARTKRRPMVIPVVMEV